MSEVVLAFLWGAAVGVVVALIATALTLEHFGIIGRK